MMSSRNHREARGAGGRAAPDRLPVGTPVRIAAGRGPVLLMALAVAMMVAPATAPAPFGTGVAVAGPAPAAPAAEAVTTPPTAAITPEAPEAAPTDSAMALAGGKDGTVFGSLTVEEENRIQVDFERPELQVAIDPQQAPGLEWGSVVDVLDRSRPDFAAPLLAGSAGRPCPYLPRPWLERFGAGPVARFRPAVKGVESWRLLVVDSRGQEVVSFSGRGDPPKEIAWDGRTAAGELAEPGLTYSHVFEAQDRAGNRRRFVGEGFQIPAYRVRGDGGIALLVSGRELSGGGDELGYGGGDGDRGGPAAGRAAGRACLLEIASRLNAAASPEQAIVIRVKARSFSEASALGDGLRRDLQPLLLGSPARVAAQAQVETGAPEGGTVMIATTAGAAPEPAATADPGRP